MLKYLWPPIIKQDESAAPSTLLRICGAAETSLHVMPVRGRGAACRTSLHVAVTPKAVWCESIKRGALAMGSSWSINGSCSAALGAYGMRTLCITRRKCVEALVVARGRRSCHGLCSRVQVLLERTFFW